MTKIEYLERRCLITENVLASLGEIIAAHLPAIQPHLAVMGSEWNNAIRKLDMEKTK